MLILVICLVCAAFLAGFATGKISDREEDLDMDECDYWME